MQPLVADANNAVPACCDVEPLPSYQELVGRFGLFGGDAACAPEAHAGGFGCACAGCARWKAFVQGSLPAEGGTHPRYEVRRVCTRAGSAPAVSGLRRAGVHT
jgi:hypothetical protein